MDHETGVVSSSASSDQAHLLRRVWLVYLCAALLFGALFALEWRLINDTVAAIARERGAALFSLIETTREWNAEHGGVYVPLDDKTQPNPYLRHPARDLETVDGRRLTMINPAFMTRQIADLAARVDGIQLHITDRRGFKPLTSVIHILALVAELYPEELVFLEYGNLKHRMFDLLAGTDRLRAALQSGSATDFIVQVQKDSEAFAETRQQFLLYR